MQPFRSQRQELLGIRTKDRASGVWVSPSQFLGLVCFPPFLIKLLAGCLGGSVIKQLTSAQVMISRLVSSSPASGEHELCFG